MNGFLNSFFVTFAALLPIVNPLSNVPLFIQFTQADTPAVRAKMARDIALASFVLLLAVMMLGSYLLVFFGLTLQAVRIGGGLVIAIMGWRMLNQGDNPIEDQPAQENGDGLRHSFYPLTMPLTVGPGSMATALALGSQYPVEWRHLERSALHGGGAVLAIAAIAVTAFVCYRFANRVLQLLGRSGTTVFMKLTAFLTLCIGIQIVLDGWRGS